MASYVRTGGNIVDNGTTEFSLQVPDSLIVGDLNVHLGISHQQDADLDVYLIGRDGTRVELFTDVGGGGDNFSGTILDDEALTSIASGSAPFAGSYQPEGALSDFDNSHAQGTWKLEITDDRNRRAGTLNSRTIEITPDAPSGPPALTISAASLREEGTIDVLVPSGSNGLGGTRGMVLHDDGLLYVVSRDNNSVMRFQPDSGEFVDVFIPSGSGGLRNAIDLAFSPQGDLLVSSCDSDEVLRYDGATGAFLTAGSGGIDGNGDILFGPDGNLYVSGFSSHNIVRYDGTTGAFLDVFVGDDPATPEVDEGGGLHSPAGLIFDSAGNLYVASYGTYQVLRYDSDGAFLGPFTPTGDALPADFVFGPEGDLYVTDFGNQRVRRYDGITGAVIGDLLNDPYKIRNPRSLLFDSVGNLIVSGTGTHNIVRLTSGPLVSLSRPSSEPVTVDYTFSSGTADALDDYLGANGTLTFAPGETSKRVWVTTVDDAILEGDETLTVTLSNPSGGAALGDSLGTVTITDDDSARSVSIQDALETEGDRTTHYRGPFIQRYPGQSFNMFAFDSSGDVYIFGGDRIERHDGATGTLIDKFFIDNTGSNGGVNRRIEGIGGDIVFHPTDPMVYVASPNTNQVIRYDAVTGDFIDVFVSSGISRPQGMAFGPDANGDGVLELYVAGTISDDVVRYDGVTGQRVCLRFSTVWWT